MVNFIERLKVCWHVLTKRNYVYFGLDNDAFVFDEDGNYVDTKLNKVASYSVISNKKINTEYGVLRFKEIDSVVKFNFNTDYGVISLKDFMWSAISDYANKQVHNSYLKGHRGDEEY